MKDVATIPAQAWDEVSAPARTRAEKRPSRMVDSTATLRRVGDSPLRPMSSSRYVTKKRRVKAANAIRTT
jgi:hypothetical protein